MYSLYLFLLLCMQSSVSFAAVGEEIRSRRINPTHLLDPAVKDGELFESKGFTAVKVKNGVLGIDEGHGFKPYWYDPSTYKMTVTGHSIVDFLERKWALHKKNAEAAIMDPPPVLASEGSEEPVVETPSEGDAPDYDADDDNSSGRPSTGTVIDLDLDRTELASHHSDSSSSSGAPSTESGSTTSSTGGSSSRSSTGSSRSRSDSGSSSYSSDSTGSTDSATGSESGSGSSSSSESGSQSSGITLSSEES
jgi:hypothetical protein